MASTLVQLRDLIKANTGVKEDPNFTNALLNRWINDAQRSVQLKLFFLGYKEFKGSDSLTLSAGTFGTTAVKTAPLSTDVPTRMGVPNWLLYIETTSGSDKGVTRPISDKDFDESLINTYMSPTTLKPICTIIDDKIYIAPSSITAATAHYYKETTDMSTDAGTLDLPEAFNSFVMRMVEMRIEDRMGKLNDKQAKMVELDKDIADSLKALQIQVTQEPNTVSLQ